MKAPSRIDMLVKKHGDFLLANCDRYTIRELINITGMSESNFFRVRRELKFTCKRDTVVITCDCAKCGNAFTYEKWRVTETLCKSCKGYQAKKE